MAHQTGNQSSDRRRSDLDDLDADLLSGSVNVAPSSGNRPTAVD
jgi:hypothetical protein